MSEAAQQWTVGRATVTSIVEDQTDGIPPELFFPALTAADVREHAWLRPHFADEDGNLSLSVQALVILVAGRTVVVDPCVGNGKKRHQPFWNEQNWPFMERFAAAGFEPSQVDLVVHTHLHTDHVGWGTRPEGDGWVPTFANARYVYVEAGLDYLRTGDHEIFTEAQQVYEDSVRPVVEAGLAETVPTDADLGDGLRLEPTPGHTPGHASLWVESDGESLLITGDAIHHPVQCTDPTVGFVTDEAPDQASATREALLRRSAGLGALTLGTHFPSPPGGYVVPDGAVWRFEPEPSWVR